MDRRTAPRSVVVGAALCGLLYAIVNPQERMANGGPPAKGPDPVSVAEAKGRARLLHEVYSNTLVVTHHYYFKPEGKTLPARAMEDVFGQVEKDTQVQARWIAVNTPAMSVGHEPGTAFEKKAADELAAGKGEYTRVEGGYYRRATPIPLGAGCVGCHTKVFQTPAKTPRFAGLVISIPVRAK